MGLSKATSFSKKQLRVSQIAKALAHPARIAIIELMLQQKLSICGYIVEKMPLTQSTVSQHLKVLKKAGLIVSVPQANTVAYMINEKNIYSTKALFRFLLTLYPALNK